MKSVLVCFALAPWFAMLGLAGRDDPANWSLPQWTAWRDAQIKRILTPTFEAKGEMLLNQREVIARCDESYTFLQPLLARPAFLADPGRAATLGNFAKFVTGQHWMSLKDSEGLLTNALGMDIPDMDYWTYVRPWVEFPDLLRSQTFLKLMANPATYKLAVDMIESQNASLPPDKKWIVFPFRAQFILSADQTTYGRMLVLIPNTDAGDGKMLDRWILFAIATPEMSPSKRIRSVSMISTLRDASNPGVAKRYMADFMRDPNPQTGQIEINPTFLDKNSPSNNCYSCHKTAVLPIHPKWAYRFAKSGALEKDPAALSTEPDVLDKMILGYGSSDFGHLDPATYGPSLGLVNKDRPDAFIARATQDHPIPTRSYARIRANMGCASCHATLAKINYPLAVRSDRDIKAFETEKGLVQSLIEGGAMPPGNTLNPEERHALWECIMKEYLDTDRQEGIFVDWLRGRVSG